MLLIGWTTVEDKADADRLASEAIQLGLAVCVQIEGPIRSIYRWDGKIEQSEEYRLVIKFLPDQGAALEAWLLAQHPYETPEWVVVRAEKVAEKYLSWARANCTSAPL